MCAVAVRAATGAAHLQQWFQLSLLKNLLTNFTKNVVGISSAITMKANLMQMQCLLATFTITRSADFPMFWRATGLKNLTDSCDPDNTMGNEHSARL